MKDRKEKVGIEEDFEGRTYVAQYEIFNLIDGWFNLIIWYQGKSVTERVPLYTQYPHDDVESQHGETLFLKLLKTT